MGNFSTLKIFILIAILFVFAVVFLIGPNNPFSFGEAYFRPRATASPTADVRLDR